MFEKRLVFVLVLTWFWNTNCQVNFFVAHKYEPFFSKYNYVCITNSSFALSSIKENIDDTLNEVSSYIPNSPNTFFDCDITNDTKTKEYYIKTPWSLQNSLESNISDVIVDRRWEDIKTVFTTEREYGNILRYSTIPLTLLKQDFEIPFSIRTEKEAHIFLCDGDFPPKSNCYWFLLQAFSGKGSAIRKCDKGAIPRATDKWAKEPCKNKLNEKNHTSFPNYLSTKAWSHFKLIKNGNHLSFNQIVGNKKNAILEWTDHSDKVINVTNMIVNSRTVNALWKIHQLEFIYTNEETNKIPLGPPLYATEDSVCISLFVSMCQSCSLNLTLSKQRSTITEKTYFAQVAGWSEIQFLVENVQKGEFGLLVSTKGTSSDRFWAIDKVRQCRKNEFRMISLGEKATCQLMSGENNVISFDNSKLTTVDTSCSENTIGEFCVPCKWIYEDCKQISICSKDQNTETKCFCSAGYQDNTQCYYACNGLYGHGCKKRCGHCLHYCNNIDGTCGDCVENYTGPKCDIPPSAAFFANAPKITDESYTTAMIHITNFELKYPTTIDDEPLAYAIQYKAVDHNQNWTYFNSNNKFNENKSFEINNLQVDTEYQARCVITTRNNVTYSGEEIPFVTFTTKCEELSEKNIQVTPSNTSVNIFFTGRTELSCKTGKYSVSIFNVGLPKTRDDSYIFFDNLTPFITYTLIFHKDSKKIEKTFQTTEGVPERVQNFAITKSSSSSIELQWHEPFFIYGKLKHYIVEYKHTAYVACNSSSNLPSTRRTVQGTSTTLADLTPFSNYSLSVYAVNTKLNGLPEIINICTLASNQIQPQEIPQVNEVVPKINKTLIKLSEVDCEKVRGPLSLIMTANCINEWCNSRQASTANYSLPGTEYSLPNLTPFSNYNLEVKFCRNDMICSVMKEQQFRTDVTVPRKVTDLSVYSKDESTISLRWKAPYPPTGILTIYKVEYFYLYGYRKSKKESAMYFNVTSCSLWSELHCAKVINLEKQIQYTLKVHARNEDPLNFGSYTQIKATTKTEASEAPYDLNFIWTTQNDLKLQWKHPNQSNGEIQYFKIELTSIQQNERVEKKLNVSEETYNLIYNYKIEAKDIIPLTRYIITVFAYNGYLGKKLNNITISPPDIPSLDQNPQFSSSNETITVNFTVKPPPRTKYWNYEIFLLIPDENANIDLYPKLKDFDLRNFRVISMNNLNNSNTKYFFIIGDNKTDNPPLKPGTSYNITIILINTVQSTSRHNIYSHSWETMGDYIPPESGTDSNSLLGLLSLLFIIPVVAILFMKRNQLISIKNDLLHDANSSTQILELHDNQNHPPKIQTSQPNTIKPAPPQRTVKAQTQRSNNPKDGNVYSKPIKVTDFEEYVKESINSGELERQHALFPRGQTKPWTYGALKENKSKNRYNNLIAYDHSRVILEKINGEPHSDYINANYIDGHRISKAYIATQGPKPSTLFDFWRMIWQENVKHIAMLANIYEDGKKKVEKYWPAINESLQFGDITIQHVSNKVHADYEFRVFKMTRNEETRQVDQLHFLSWPDHGVPLYSQSIVPFLQKMLKFPLTPKSPVVIHCSAGVGRTGTILLCDICLRMAARESSIDVLRKLQKLRDQRANLVDNIEQYKLAHLVILECLAGMHTTIPCNQIDQSVQKLLRNGVRSQMQYLKDTQWQDQAMKTIGQYGKTALIVNEKNRFPDIIPEIQGRVFITRYPPEDETSSYINAIKVDGFRSPGRFIVTQQPMPNTLGDFWRLVDENYISVIISLNEVNPKDKTSCHFWPTANRPQMNPVPSMTLKHANTLSLECYDLITIHLNRNNAKEHDVVEIFSMKNWPSKSNCPKTMQEMLTFLEDSDAASRKSRTVVVTCYDGVKASGLYVALSFVIEKMKLEQSCDVCQAVRSVRHNREQFVQDEEQFIFLYRAAVEYINGFQSYANFT